MTKTKPRTESYISVRPCTGREELALFSALIHVSEIVGDDLSSKFHCFFLGVKIVCDDFGTVVRFPCAEFVNNFWVDRVVVDLSHLSPQGTWCKGAQKHVCIIIHPRDLFVKLKFAIKQLIFYKTKPRAELVHLHGFCRGVILACLRRETRSCCYGSYPAHYAHERNESNGRNHHLCQ
jgi:hypothetical protein